MVFFPPSLILVKVDFRHCPERVRSFVMEGRKCKYLPLPVWVLLLLFFCSHHLIMILQISLLDGEDAIEFSPMLQLETALEDRTGELYVGKSLL